MGASWAEMVQEFGWTVSRARVRLDARQRAGETEGAGLSGGVQLAG
jgi:hypothetical protein